MRSKDSTPEETSSIKYLSKAEKKTDKSFLFQITIEWEKQTFDQGS